MRPTALKTLWIFASTFLVLAGCWFDTMELLLRHPGFVLRGAVAVLVVVHGALTLSYIRRRTTALRATVMAGSVGALLLGAYAVYTELHAIDFEGYILLMGFGLIAQGLLTIACTGPSSWSSAAPRTL